MKLADTFKAFSAWRALLRLLREPGEWTVKKGQDHAFACVLAHGNHVAIEVGAWYTILMLDGGYVPLGRWRTFRLRQAVKRLMLLKLESCL